MAPPRYAGESRPFGCCPPSWPPSRARSIRPKLGAEPPQQSWHVVYRYENAGRTLQGQSRMLTSEAVENFKPGDRVNIKIDPQKPEHSLFLGKE
ncbi:MAG: DUF3592 domain-containing protein [Alphaproteobacteria bacterium]